MTANRPIHGRVRAVVFDCGDTLVQLDPPKEEIFQAVAAEAGIRLGLPGIRRAYEIVESALPARSSRMRSARSRERYYLAWNTALCHALGIAASAAALHPILRQRFAAERNWTSCAGAAESLALLSRRAPLYVLANWDLRLRAVLESVGLSRWFRAIYSSADLGAEKPALACFRAFLNRAGISAATTVYVGNDYVADVVGARRAGLTPILVDRGNRLPAADCIRIRSLHELGPVLADHWG